MHTKEIAAQQYVLLINDGPATEPVELRLWFDRPTAPTCATAPELDVRFPLPAGVISVDSGGQILTCNRAATEMLAQREQKFRLTIAEGEARRRVQEEAGKTAAGAGA